ncbi:MAG: ATP-binding protein [Elusimicrobia bacterium]|nr:ATP-binding protein [Elusimicrobiota bacterium]
MAIYLRKQTKELIKRLQEPVGLIEAVIGPRQVGKTTALYQAIKKLGFKTVFAAADAPAPPPLAWIQNHWKRARKLAQRGRPALAAFDEIQKIPGWSEIVKKEFDADQKLPPKRRCMVIVAGSSALMMERGLTESLAGRFELVRFPHWDWPEEQQAFGIDLATHISMGGYPKLREFLPNEARFREYVKNAIIESVLSKDILLLHPVEKPALLRRLFEFACYHPAEIVSLQKMLGQLTDKGNVTTIAHYLDLLAKAFLVTGLQKYSAEILRVRGSSPKFIVQAPALLAAIQDQDRTALRAAPNVFGRWVENAAGAHLVRSGLDVFYWRERDLEVDFVARKGSEIIAIEIGTSPKKRAPNSLKIFAARHKVKKILLIGAGPGQISLDRFLGSDPLQWFD